MDRTKTFLTLAIVLPALSLACGRGAHTGPLGTIITVDTLGSRYGVDFFQPVEAIRGSDGKLYLLDQGNSELYRLGAAGIADTLAREGVGPGELQSPSAFMWMSDSSLVILDSGNKRLQYLDLTGMTLRTVPYQRGATSATFDIAEERLFASTFGRGFRIVASRPQVQPDSLVSIISLSTGKVEGAFGSPRPYPQGTLVTVAGNYVQITRNPISGEIWIAWPVDPVVARYDSNGKFISQFERPLTFKPSAPREIRTTESPFPRADFQQISFDVAVDSTNLLYVLTPIAAKKGLVGSELYQPPPQSVDVLNADGELQCRVVLPFIASSLALDGKGTLILMDAIDVGEVYRVQYKCPTTM